MGYKRICRVGVGVYRVEAVDGYTATDKGIGRDMLDFSGAWDVDCEFRFASFGLGI